MPFPHNLVLDSQPRFELTQFEFLNLNNFHINWPMFMKIVEKCSDFVSLSHQVQVKVCNPTPLTALAGYLEKKSIISVSTFI